VSRRKNTDTLVMETLIMNLFEGAESRQDKADIWWQAINYKLLINTEGMGEDRSSILIHLLSGRWLPKTSKSPQSYRVPQPAVRRPIFVMVNPKTGVATIRRCHIYRYSKYIMDF